jgi:hypothetical protein
MRTSEQSDVFLSRAVGSAIPYPLRKGKPSRLFAMYRLLVENYSPRDFLSRALLQRRRCKGCAAVRYASYSRRARPLSRIGSASVTRRAIVGGWSHAISCSHLDYAPWSIQHRPERSNGVFGGLTKRSPGAGFIGDPVHRLVMPWFIILFS